MTEKEKLNTDSLKSIALYLSGLKEGKGNLLPLGNIVLDDLWYAISYLESNALLKLIPSEKDVLNEGEKQISDWLKASTEMEKEHYRVAFRRSYEYIARTIYLKK